MANVLKLGFKDNPTVGSDDCIDLVSSGLTSGYMTKKIDLGAIRLDPLYNRPVRTITLQLEVRGTGIDDAISKLRALYRYIEQTEIYFKPFGGNLPARADLSWHQGEAAVLTYQLQGATNIVYWNVLGGDVAVSPPMDSVNTPAYIFACTVTLIVEAAARGTRAKLDNLIACGDFAPPFTPNDSAFTAGWSFTGTWSDPAGDTTNRYWWAMTAAAGATATSYEAGTATYDFNTGDVLLPRISIKVATKPSSGTLSCVMQTWNGASWSTQQTLFSITSGTSISLNTWLHYSGTAYTAAAGITKVRFSINTGSASTSVSFAGAAIWRNPVGNAEPTEFVAGGRTGGVPYLNVYNVQGDIPAPLALRMKTAAGSIAHVGHTLFNPSVDKPFFALSLKAASSVTSATSLYWGLCGRVGSGAGTSSSFTLTTRETSFDRRVRRYVAYLAYAANDHTTITAVSIRISPGPDVKTYNVALPTTYTGNVDPVEANYRLYRLGEFLYSRPGAPFIEDVNVAISSSDITFTHASDANRHMGVGGLLLLPAEEFAVMDGNGTSFGTGVFTYTTETSAPRVVTYSPSYFSITAPSEFYSGYPTGQVTGDMFALTPNQSNSSGVYTADRFEFMLARSKDSTYNDLLTYNASDAFVKSVEYTPRYVFGAS